MGMGLGRSFGTLIGIDGLELILVSWSEKIGSLENLWFSLDQWGSREEVGDRKIGLFGWALRRTTINY